MNQPLEAAEGRLPSSPSQGNWAIVLAAIALALLPLLFVQGEYGGADEEAEAAIANIRPEYEPWFGDLIEPASGEIESLLFASQAAISAGIVGYAIGLYKGRSSAKKQP